MKVYVRLFPCLKHRWLVLRSIYSRRVFRSYNSPSKVTSNICIPGYPHPLESLTTALPLIQPSQKREFEFSTPKAPQNPGMNLGQQGTAQSWGRLRAIPAQPSLCHLPAVMSPQHSPAIGDTKYPLALPVTLHTGPVPFQHLPPWPTWCCTYAGGATKTSQR